jgi:hypothetical protein
VLWHGILSTVASDGLAVKPRAGHYSTTHFLRHPSHCETLYSTWTRSDDGGFHHTKSASTDGKTYSVSCITAMLLRVKRLRENRARTWPTVLHTAQNCTHIGNGRNRSNSCRKDSSEIEMRPARLTGFHHSTVVRMLHKMADGMRLSITCQLCAHSVS